MNKNLVTRCLECPFFNYARMKCKEFDRPISYREYLSRNKPNWCELERAYVCPACTGEKKRVVFTYLGNSFERVTCDYCGGTGKVTKEKVYIRKRGE